MIRAHRFCLGASQHHQSTQSNTETIGMLLSFFFHSFKMFLIERVCCIYITGSNQKSFYLSIPNWIRILFLRWRKCAVHHIYVHNSIYKTCVDVCKARSTTRAAVVFTAVFRTAVTTTATAATFAYGTQTFCSLQKYYKTMHFFPPYFLLTTALILFSRLCSTSRSSLCRRKVH